MSRPKKETTPAPELGHADLTPLSKLFELPRSLSLPLDKIDRLAMVFQKINLGLDFELHPGMRNIVEFNKWFQKTLKLDEQPSAPKWGFDFPPPQRQQVQIDNESIKILANALNPKSTPSYDGIRADFRGGAVWLEDNEPIPVRNVGAMHFLFNRLFSPPGREIHVSTLDGELAKGEDKFRMQFNRNRPKVLEPAYLSRGRGGCCYVPEILGEISAQLKRAQQ